MAPSPENIVGGSFFGNLLSALFFGVLTIQTYSYYRAFPNDGTSVKLVVGFLWTLEGFQHTCSTQSLYWRVVTNHHNFVALNRATWEFAVFQLSAVCASVTVQTFFAYRLYSLSTSLYLGMLVQFLVLAQFGFGVANGVIVNMILDPREIVRKYRWVAMSWLTIQAIADVVIAISMCLVLRRRRTGFQKTDSVINRMVLYTISTGLVTGILSCLLLGMFSKYGLDFKVLTISLPLGVIYSVTMLANLHMRKRLQARLDTPSLFELISSSMKMRIRRKPEDPGNGEAIRYSDTYRQRSAT